MALTENAIRSITENIQEKVENVNDITTFCSCRQGIFRYGILAIAAFCLTSISSNMIAFNFTQILMRRANWENASFPKSSPILVSDSDVHLEEDMRPVLVLNGSHVVPPTVPYSAQEKALLLYAVGAASILSTFPFSALYTRFGARLVFFGAGLFSAVATALLPLAAAHGMTAFLLVRFVQGFAYGANFAAIGFICHRWASLSEHGLFLAILQNKVVLVVWLNSFADIVTIVFITTYMPVYVSKVLRYGVRETGIWSALPGLIQIPLRPLLGILSDRSRCVNEVNKMRLFNSVALVGSALCFALVGFVPENLPLLAVFLMTLNTASTAANTGGLYKCGTFVSRQYAHFVIAGIQFEKSITLFVSPLIFTFFITDESSLVQWRTIFLAMFAILTIANAFFLYTVTDQPAQFTKVPLINDSKLT